LEKERQEALKQQQQQEIGIVGGKDVENGQSNKLEENPVPVVPIKNEEISVNVEMLKKIQIHEEAKASAATNPPPKVLEEKIVDIDEPAQEVKQEELPKNNGNGGMPTPQQVFFWNINLQLEKFNLNFFAVFFQ